MAPELPVQAAEDLLSTPMFNLIHSFGVDLHHAEAYIGKTTRMSRFERLSTDGGQLDGSGIDPKVCGVFKSSLIDLECLAA